MGEWVGNQIVDGGAGTSRQGPARAIQHRFGRMRSRRERATFGTCDRRFTIPLAAEAGAITGNPKCHHDGRIRRWI